MTNDVVSMPLVVTAIVILMRFDGRKLGVVQERLRKRKKGSHQGARRPPVTMCGLCKYRNMPIHLIGIKMEAKMRQQTWFMCRCSCTFQNPTIHSYGIACNIGNDQTMLAIDLTREINILQNPPMCLRLRRYIYKFLKSQNTDGSSDTSVCISIL